MKPNWIDVTMAIAPDMMVYKNKEEKRPVIESIATHEKQGYHESTLFMNLHTGTHLDMPLHMVADGATSTTFDVGRVNGKAFLVDFSQSEDTAIGEGFLKTFEADIKGAEIVLLKTKNSLSSDFSFEFDYLAADGAAYLRTLGIKAVGIDALGIERGSATHETHKILMDANVVIIEGLVLNTVPSGFYHLHCYPLKIIGVEGLPARAFLEKLV